VENTDRSAWQVMGGQVRDAYLSIVSYPASAFYEASVPMLNMAVAALFVLGLAYSLWRLRDRRHLLLVLEVAGGLAVLALGQNATIAVYRVAGVMPVFILLATVALWLLVEGAFQGLGTPKRAPVVVVAGLVAALVTYDLSYYFGEHLPKCRYTDERSAMASVVGEYIGNLPEDATVFALTPPHLNLGVYPSVPYLTGRQTVQFEPAKPGARQPGDAESSAYVFEVPAEAPALSELVRGSGPAVVLASPEREGELAAIRRQLPGGESLTLEWCGNVAAKVFLPPPPAP
jgi:hypothetical protein